MFGIGKKPAPPVETQKGGATAFIANTQKAVDATKADHHAYMEARVAEFQGYFKARVVAIMSDPWFNKVVEEHSGKVDAVTLHGFTIEDVVGAAGMALGRLVAEHPKTTDVISAAVLIQGVANVMMQAAADELASKGRA